MTRSMQPMTIHQMNNFDIPSRGQIAESVAYFNLVSERLHQAARATGGFIDYFYKIGGHFIKLRFVGAALVPHITPALAHLTAEPAPRPELTIYLWDSESTGISMPPPSWQATDHIFRGEVPGYNNERIRAAFHQWAEVFSTLDNKLNQAIFWTSNADQLDYTMSSAPLRDILHWWMNRRGRQLVHSGGVGTSTGGVLLAGRGGSGKSTTALACLNTGLFYAGDDHVLINTNPFPFLHSLYNTAKINVDHVHRFPNLIPAIENQEQLETQKARIFLHHHHPDKIITGFPLRAILLPYFSGLSQTKLRKVSPAESLKALAPTTLYQLPKAGAEALQNMTRLVREVPGYILELGTDISQIPQAISELLARERCEKERV